MAKIPNSALREMSKPANRVLSKSMASTSTDPQFYSTMNSLPNPDPILRKLGLQAKVFEAIGYDAHVMGELRALRGDVLSNEWRIQSGGDSTQDIKALELCEKVFSRVPAKNLSWSDLIWSLYGAIFNGFAVAEIEWKREGEFIVPERISDKPQRRFKFNYDHQLRLLVKGNTLDGIECPNMKFLLARHMPSHDNPYGVAIFSALFWPYTFKHNGFKWFAKFLERYGIPSPIGKYPVGTSDGEQQKLLTNLLSMVEDAAAVIPNDASVELLETKTSARNTHGEFLNFCNREMSKALTSQTLGSEVTESGSRSTGEVQADRQKGNAESDIEMVQRTMQSICDWITVINFGSEVNAPKWQFYDDQDVAKDTVETIEVASRIVPLKASEVYERLQYTPPESGDDVVYNGTNPSTGVQLPPANNFGLHNHDFAQLELDEVQALADQGDKAAQATIEKMTNTLHDFIHGAESLDEIEKKLPTALDNVDSSGLVSAIADATTIAAAAGLDE